MRFWASLVTIVPAAFAAEVGWTNWFRGIMAGFIGGGAGAFSGGLAGILVAPDQVNFAHPRALLNIMAGTFLINGCLHMMAFLAQNPVPSVTTISSTQKVTQVPSENAVVTEKITETKTGGQQ